MKRYKRRNIFIKKEFQGRLIFGYFLFVTGGVLLFIFLLTVFSADTLTISYNNNDLQLGQTPIMLLKKTLAAHWIFIVVGTIFLVMAAMLITHRIAGPMFRFERALDSMLKHNLNDTIYLRTKDESKDLAQKINDFNADLSNTIRRIRSQSSAINSLLEQERAKLDKHYSQEQTEQLQSLFWTIEEKSKRIENVCSSYVLKDV